MNRKTFNGNMLFAIDDLQKAIWVIKEKVQELEAAVAIIDMTRYLAVTDGLKETEAEHGSEGD